MASPRQLTAPAQLGQNCAEGQTAEFDPANAHTAPICCSTEVIYNALSSLTHSTDLGQHRGGDRRLKGLEHA